MSAMLDESAILSAADLGLSEEERKALIQTRRMLAEERVPYASDYGKPGFNMNIEATRYNCGAACCIGGHMSLIMQGVQEQNGIFHLTRDQASIAKNYVGSKDSGEGIGALFWPRELEIDEDSVISGWEDITPKIAVRAIDRFLMTGKPDWDAAISAA